MQTGRQKWQRRAVEGQSGAVVLLALLLPTVLIGLTTGAVYRERRQERLDRELIAAVRGNDTRAVLSLLERGADANARAEAHRAVSIWRWLGDRLRGAKPQPSTAPTPLLLALMWKDERDADGNVAFTPENVPLVHALLDHGADANARLDPMECPLFFAILDAKNATIHLLLAHGAKSGPTAGRVFVPIVDAAGNWRIDGSVLTDLIDHGADVNTRDGTGDTALFAATMTANTDAVRVLLARHADPMLKGWHGSTPLALARQFSGPPEIVRIARMLEKAGAKE